ncbi:MAG: Npun_R2821/Npun_R2822 family protein [Leptolyngbyaceae cyanobacterium]
MKKGICTLANDVVYDQVLALINSIEFHAGSEMPVCIYPYDNRLDRLRELSAERPQVFLFEDESVINRWDDWVQRLWDCHPTAAKTWLALNGKPGIHRMGTHRRFCAFEGPFDQFIYMDADALLMNSPTIIFSALEEYDWVTYDFQYKDLGHVFDVESPRLTHIFSEKDLMSKTFCSGFYASKRGSVTPKDIDFYLDRLAQGEAEVLYPMAPDQTLLNYFVLSKPITSTNLALSLSPRERTGNSVTSKHFEQQGGLLFDKGIQLLYLHYIGISSRIFARLCQGENLEIPYRDIFLHYRYLNSPGDFPDFKEAPKSYQLPPLSMTKRLKRKISKIFSSN